MQYFKSNWIFFVHKENDKGIKNTNNIKNQRKTKYDQRALVEWTECGMELEKKNGRRQSICCCDGKGNRRKKEEERRKEKEEGKSTKTASSLFCEKAAEERG